MRSIVIAFFLLLSVSGFSQTRQDSINRAHTDSVISIQEKRNDSIQRAEDMDRNIGNLLQIQKENNKKQKKAAIIRIGIGVGFLVILIIGLMRRRKKK